jgi:hypothetical protein
MRARNVALIVAIFGAAAATAAFVVSQLPREGQVSPLPPAPVAAAPAGRSPPAPAARAGDGAIEVRVTAGRSRSPAPRSASTLRRSRRTRPGAAPPRGAPT